MRQSLESDSRKTDQIVTRVRRLSQFLDNAIAIPGTSYRVGIDPLLGLFPGIGDYLGAFFSGYIIFEAARLGASRATLGRMFFNVILETIVGLIPGLGDIFDVFWKANAKNQTLLEQQLASSQMREKADWWFVIALLVGLVLLIVGVASLSIWIVISVIQTSPFF